jgi:hypothetical protein
MPPTATPLLFHKPVTGKPAPRDTNNNPMIDIEIQGEQVIFHCALEEHVGTHKNRKVRYQANADCNLYFSNSAVFGTDRIHLKKGVPQWMSVQDTTANCMTEYAVEPAKMSSAMVAPTVFSPPRIVVP